MNNNSKVKTVNKILVIGAGIAGPVLCYWLNKYGFSPTLVEKHPNISKGGQGLDVRGVAIDVAQKMGIYEEICKHRTKVERGQYVGIDGNLIREEHAETVGFRYGDEVEIYRGNLIEILIKNIPSVPCLFGKYVEKIQQNDDDITVSFNDGKIEKYDLVIGNDGIHSSLRHMIFDKEDFTINNLGIDFCTFSIPNFLKLNRTKIICENKQKLVSILSDEDIKTAVAAFMFRSFKKLKDISNQNEQKNFVRNAFHDFGWEMEKILDLMSQSDDFYFDSANQVKMNSWTKGRVALVGDAAYCPSPLSGQGNNLAFVGAYILAGELKTHQGDYIHAFSRYNSLLRSFVDANQALGVWVSESFLVDEVLSSEIAEKRQEKTMKMVYDASHAIVLPKYEE